MAEHKYSFQCRKCIKKDDGTIGYYVLEVTDLLDGMIEEISVEPQHLISARSMKKILLERRILYFTTQSKHDKMLNDLFATQPEVT